MRQALYQAAEQPLDALSEEIDRLLDSEELEATRRLLLELNRALGTEHGASLRLVVDVVDYTEERVLPVCQTSLSTDGGTEVHRTWDDASLQRYLLEGEIVVTPHDHCPKCWEPWLFKFERMICPHCGVEMGDELKVLLDDDACPHCQQGTVSMADPTCTRCGFEVDPEVVAWG